MKQFMAMVITVFFITACATQSQQAKTEGTLGGAGIGAAAGALIGGLAGGWKGAAIGAGIGGGIGAIGGYAYASKIDKRRQELAGKENDLDAQIKFAHSVNQDAQAYNQQLENKIQTSQTEVNQLLAKTQQQKIKQAELQQKKAQLNHDVQEANKAVAATQQQLDYLREVQPKQLDTPAKKNLHDQIVKLEDNLAQLKANTKALADLDERL